MEASAEELLEHQQVHDANASLTFYRNMVTGVEYTKSIRDYYTHWSPQLGNNISFGAFILGTTLYLAEIGKKLKKLRAYIVERLKRVGEIPPLEKFQKRLMFYHAPLAHDVFFINKTEFHVGLDELVSAVAKNDRFDYARYLHTMQIFLESKFDDSKRPELLPMWKFVDDITNQVWDSAFSLAAGQMTLSAYFGVVDTLYSSTDPAFSQVVDACFSYARFVLDPTTVSYDTGGNVTYQFSEPLRLDDTYRAVAPVPKSLLLKDYDYGKEFDTELLDEYDIDFNFGTVAAMQGIAGRRVTLTMHNDCVLLLQRSFARSQVIALFRRAYLDEDGDDDDDNDSDEEPGSDIDEDIRNLSLGVVIADACRYYDAVKHVNVLDLSLFNVDPDVIERIVTGLVDMIRDVILDNDLSESGEADASDMSGNESDDNELASEDEKDSFIVDDDANGGEEANVRQARANLKKRQAGGRKVAVVDRASNLSEYERPWTKDRPVPECEADPGFHLYRILFLEYRNGLFGYKSKHGKPDENYYDLVEAFLTNGYPILAFHHGSDKTFEADVAKQRSEQLAHGDLLRVRAVDWTSFPHYSMADQFWSLLDHRTRSWFQDCARFIAKCVPVTFSKSWWLDRTKTGPLPWLDGWKLVRLFEDALNHLRPTATEENDFIMFIESCIDSIRIVRELVDSCPHRDWLARHAAMPCGLDTERLEDMVESIVDTVLEISDDNDGEKRADFVDLLVFLLQETDQAPSVTAALAHHKFKRHAHVQVFQGVPNVLIVLAHTMLIASRNEIQVKWKRAKQGRGDDDDLDKSDFNDERLSKKPRYFYHFLSNFRRFDDF